MKIVDDALINVGLPVIGSCRVQGIHETENPSSFYIIGTNTIRVDWSRDITPEESNLAQTTLQGLDLRSRKNRPLMVVAQEIKAYILAGSTTAQQLNRLANTASMALAIAMRTDPSAAKDMGLPIEGDEPI